MMSYFVWYIFKVFLHWHLKKSIDLTFWKAVQKLLSKTFIVWHTTDLLLSIVTPLNTCLHHEFKYFITFLLTVYLVGLCDAYHQLLYWTYGTYTDLLLVWTFPQKLSPSPKLMISLMQVDNSINLLFGVFASAGPADAGIIPIRGPLHLVVQKKPSKYAAETPLIIQYSYPPTDSFPNTSACPIMTNRNHSIKSETPDVKIEEISNLIFFTCCGERLGYDDVRREWLVSYCSWPRACFEMSSFLPPSLAPCNPPLSTPLS